MTVYAYAVFVATTNKSVVFKAKLNEKKEDIWLSLMTQ